ncbi:MAG: hypothetical protein M1497_01660 [Nitrospirae bacterium]|nr:hypothetical protein [Nitrospirota bacterium]
MTTEGERTIETDNRSIGRGKHQISKSRSYPVTPNPMYTKTMILDATPPIVRRYAMNEKQLQLAILRSNRLVDAFLHLTCYSIQNNLRATVRGMGQTEIDEIYIGLDHQFRQFVIPVQAKGKDEQIGIVQIEQDVAVCKTKFPSLICRPVAAQFVERDLIALFEFERSEGMVSIKDEKHYRIVPNEMLAMKR